MSTPDRHLIALECKLSLGGFSGERIFEVKLADGKAYRGLAPRQFCWSSEKRLVAEREPTEPAAGLVAAKELDRTEDGQVIVEVPDGEVIAVDRTTVMSRPTPIRPTEPRIHVSL